MLRRILLGGALVLCPTAVLAQDSPALVEYYGDGVHAFSSGDTFESHRLLTQAIEGGIQDPRAYYFRAMTLLRMGRNLEAEADMEAGAYLEARAPSGAYAVDRSIQRLQGRDRLALEKIRRRVRFDVEQERRTEMQQRYEQTQRNEGVILRSERRPTYDEALQSGAGVTDLPGEDAPAEAPATEVTPVVPPVAPPTEATAPVQDTPPAIEPPPADATDAVDPSAVEPAEGSGDNPFSTDGNPFSEVPEPSDAAATGDPGADVAVEVGQKIKGTKLLGILGSIFGDVVESAGDAVASAVPQPPMGAGMPFGGEAGPPEGEPFGEGDPFGGIAPANGAQGANGEQRAPPVAEDDPLGGESNPFGGLEQAPANENSPESDAAPPADDNNPFGGIESDAPSDSNNPFGAAEDPFNG